MKHAFVTGGTGFIGTNLIKLLSQKGWEVTALYRPQSNRSVLNFTPVHWVKGEITDAQTLIKAIPRNTDVVFHLAGDTNLWAQNNPRQTAVNVSGTGNMVVAAAQKEVDVFVHTSSVAAWGNVTGKVTERDEQQGNHSWINYEHTKWISERKALDGLNHGMKVVILNPAHVVGPHDKNNWGRLFLALQNNNLPFIADGCVSITHVNNVVRAHLAAALHGKAGERYILAGKTHLFSDFIACINEVTSARNMPTKVPPSFFRAYARLSSAFSSMVNRKPTLTPELAHIMTRRNVNYISSKAADQLNYEISPMRKSIIDCYSWLKSEHLL